MSVPVTYSTALEDQTMSTSAKRTNTERENCPRDSGSACSPEARDETPSPETSDQDQELIELTNMPKKKKRSKLIKPSDSVDREVPVEEDGGFNPSLLKKKRKKKPSPGTSSFDTQLAETGVPELPNTDAPSEYKQLLTRFYTLLHADHPELAEGGRTAIKRIPALVLFKESKKTIFATCPKLCEYLKRPDEHVAQYLFAELGTTGNFDGTRRLVIKGKFHQMQLETVIKRYMAEYVHCQTCKTLDTNLAKGENRLVFLTCNKCESRRSVSAIKTGFVAHVGRRKHMKAN